jgi:hypothetical protein
MPLTDEQLYLAETCYGYGSWDAPYWFIGPEQGQDKNENGINSRYRALRDLQIDGLCDCRTFHSAVEGNAAFNIRANGKMKLQNTWNYQIELLYGYWGKVSSPEIRRSYQGGDWGSKDGKTCITELRGLPAHNGKLSVDQDTYLEGRAKFLRKKVQSHSPEFVVFYGTGDQMYWDKIADCDLVLDTVSPNKKTAFAYLPHPNARKDLKRSLGHWRSIGETLCQAHQRLYANR